MQDAQKTKKQLLDELNEVRRQMKDLTASEVKHGRNSQGLIHSEEKYLKAFLSSPIAVCLVSTEDFKFQEVNNAFIRFVGYPRAEIIGHTPRELNLWVAPEDIKTVGATFRKTGRLANQRIRSRMKSGEIRTGLSSSETIDIAGKKYIILVITDITDQVKAEEAFQKSEENFNKAFQACPGILYVTRIRDGICLEVNDSFARVLGFTRKELIGHTYTELNLFADPADRKKITDRFAKNQHISNEEHRLRTKTGEIRTLLLSTAETIEFDGEPCILTFANDITDYKRMEAQAHEVANLRELDKLRTELFSNISHELRTPLASIKGFATMLLDYGKRLTTKEKREYLETIDKNTDRMVGLIEQLLEMSRLEAGMLSFQKAPVNIINLCQVTINQVRDRVPDRYFVLDLPPKLSIMNVDQSRIRQVLDNVINNAVKYSAAGTEIVLSVHESKDEMLFSITDHGIGIPEKDLPRLFHRLFRLSQQQKPESAGAGLSLLICKGLIEEHGGKIWIESKEGIGTSCYFTLPITPLPKSQPTES